MKRIAKILAWILGIALLGILVFAAYIQLKGIPSYPVQNIEITVTPTPGAPLLYQNSTNFHHCVFEAMPTIVRSRIWPRRAISDVRRVLIVLSLSV